MEKKAHNEYFGLKDNLTTILLMLKVFNGGSEILCRL